MKGIPLTEEHKRKIGLAVSIANRGKHYSPRTEFKKGRVPWNKGVVGVIKFGRQIKYFSEESRQKIRLAHLGKSPWNKGTKGLHLSPKSEFKKGRKPTENWYKKMVGRVPWNKGKSWSEEVCKKLSLAQFKRFEDITRHPNWQGGKSFEPYTPEFRLRLKREVRERDDYLCQVCGKSEGEIGKKHDIHHIDYKKDNCNLQNLVSLCHSCHCKTNFNRIKWLKYFLDKSR